MIAISNHDSQVIGANRYHHRFCIRKRIYFTAINDSLDLQETQQYLVLSLQDNMIRGGDNLQFTGQSEMVNAITTPENHLRALIIAIKSPATSDAPPTSPPSTSGQANNSAALPAFTLPP